jgi:hypothetical protein
MGTAISIYLSRCTLSFLVCSRYTERERERELGRLVMIGVRCSQVIRSCCVFSKWKLSRSRK